MDFKKQVVRCFKGLKLMLSVFFEFLMAFMICYVLVFLLFSPFTTEEERTTDPKTEEILVSFSGIHSDIILPIQHPIKNWKTDLSMQKLLAVDTFQTHLKFGWGDKNFFLKTKEWSDLTAGTLFKTIFGSGEGAIHLVLCTPKDLDPQSYVRLFITKKQYSKLCDFIQHSIRFQHQKPSLISNHPYGTYHFFYNSTIRYNMSYTCNTWTNDVLKRAGVKGCVWTPFKGPILSKLKK